MRRIAQKSPGVVWRSLGAFSPREITNLGFLLLARIALGALDLAGILLIGILGAIVSGEEFPDQLLFVPQDIFGPANSTQLLALALSATGLFILKSFLSALTVMATARYLAKIENKIASRLFQSLFDTKQRALATKELSQLQFGLGFSSYLAFTRIPFSVMNLIADSVLALAIVVMFFTWSPLVALSALAYFTVVVTIFQKAVSAPLRRVGEKLSAQVIDVSQKILESLALRDEITLSNRRDWFVERFSKSRDIYSRGHANERFLTGLPRYYLESAVVLGLALAFLISSIFFPAQGLSGASLFLAGAFRAAGALLPIQQALADLRTDGPQAEPALSLFEESVETTSPAEPMMGDNSAAAAESAPAIELVHVRFSYEEEDRTVLEDVSLRIEPGQAVAVVGPSGAGKTTLVKLMIGLLKPQSGCALIDNADAEDWLMSPFGRVGYLPQQAGVFGGSLVENVALGDCSTEELRFLAEQALRDTELLEVLARNEMGLDSRLRLDAGSNSANLSGGQKQRLGLARVLYLGPKIAVLDEPTSSLDSETEDFINSTLAKMKGKVTLIVISHRPSMMPWIDRTFSIRNQRVEEIPSQQNLPEENA